MAFQLYIPHCIGTYQDSFHSPKLDKALRIHIEGPLISINKLLPGTLWRTEIESLVFPQPASTGLARLIYQQLYGQKVRDEIADDMVIRDEYLGWVVEKPLRRIDYYGVTFDHLVPPDMSDPDVLQINIIEVDDDQGVYANEYLMFEVKPTDYKGKVLAVPRCCQKRKGTQDRGRVNDSVNARDKTEIVVENV